MKLNTGKVFSIVEENEPIRGCTVSSSMHNGLCSITCFSLDAHTDISAEIYPYYKFLIMLKGNADIYSLENSFANLKDSECFITPVNEPVGIKANDKSVYLEVLLGKEFNMNEAINAGEVFKLADLVPYQEGKIVNFDVLHNPMMKFVIMAFDEGTGLSEHAAPGEAIIFALDGD